MKRTLVSLVWAAVLAWGAVARATTTIYPVGAIDDFWNLPAEEFRQKYAGINATGLGPSDEGWYVRYRHENLTCLFGPLADREEARKRKWDMEAVRDAAIRNRPTLTTSQVDYVRFTFTSVYGRSGDGTGGAGEMARVSADGKSGPDGDLDGDGIPNSKDDDMDGDGIPNDKDDDVDGDGIPNAQDGYPYGTMDGKLQGGAGSDRISADGKSGPDGDMDGDGISNSRDGDMNGNGIPNGQDPDIDGDGIPNAQDDYPFGTDPRKDGGQGDSRMAGKDGAKSGQKGQGSEASDGSESGSQGQQQVGSGQQGQRQVASNQRSNRSGQQSSQSGQQGQQQSQQSSGQQSSSSSSQSSSSGGQSGGPPSGSSGGGGNPLSLLSALLRAILGL